MNLHEASSIFTSTVLLLPSSLLFRPFISSDLPAYHQLQSLIVFVDNVDYRFCPFRARLTDLQRKELNSMELFHIEEFSMKNWNLDGGVIELHWNKIIRLNQIVPWKFVKRKIKHSYTTKDGKYEILNIFSWRRSAIKVSNTTAYYSLHPK